MGAISRREFFRKAGSDAAVAAFLAAGVAKLHANPLGLPIGSQTYPHRAMIKEGNFPGLLKTLKDIGVERIELCSAIGYGEFASLSDGKQTRKIIEDHGLRCESGHFGMRELREKQAESIAWAKDVGITQMVTATLGAPPDKAPVTMDYVKKAADEYNKIAEVAARAGIQQGLHNEGFELSEVDGRRTYDVLLELLDPKLVKFQFQMSTISRGFIAADYFTKYPGRFISMHQQDVDLNATSTPAPAPTAGQAPAGQAAPAQGAAGGRGRGQRPVGQGSIDWVKTFQAAKVGGVKNYFVEQNMELTKESVAFLKTLNI
jgi:sugar phosphate isomerase/epimerase